MHVDKLLLSHASLQTERSVNGMDVPLRVDISTSDLLHRRISTSTWARGTAFGSGGQCRNSALSELFTSVVDVDQFVRMLNGLNGFFAIASVQRTRVYCAVDRVRSIPLYYFSNGDRFLLSEDPCWIQARLGGAHGDSLAVAEFLLTGYVTGSCTLDLRIRQLQAGEALVVSWGRRGIKAERIRYYEFRHTECSEDIHNLCQELDAVAMSSIERLMSYANGRRIVIPLSGGLDSRLIAMSLKRAGYDDVICFSYGVPGNTESLLSQSVAKQMGLPWYFVEYSADKWREWAKSEVYERYREVGGGMTSLAHCQDWPAIMELIQREVLTPSDVVVPGHSADFVAGSHIPPESRRMVRGGLERVALMIWNHHYGLNSVKTASRYSGVQETEIQMCLRQKILRLLERAEAGDPSQIVDAYEYWDWQERQAKFIVNSVRVYDFWGCDWWLPWWDAEFMAFWLRAPLQARWGKRLYNKYVQDIQGSLGISTDSASRGIASVTVNTVKRLEVIRVAACVYNWLGGWSRKLRTHPLALSGLVKNSDALLLRGRHANVNSVLVFDQLRQVDWLGLRQK